MYEILYWATSTHVWLPPEFKHINEGRKRNNRDSLSSGERNGKSPARRVVGFNAYWPIPCKGGSIILRI